MKPTLIPFLMIINYYDITDFLGRLRLPAVATKKDGGVYDETYPVVACLGVLLPDELVEVEVLAGCIRT